MGTGIPERHRKGFRGRQTRTIIERLSAYSDDVNAAGQWSY
jgi:hypothetical protein